MRQTLQARARHQAVSEIEGPSQSRFQEAREEGNRLMPVFSAAFAAVAVGAAAQDVFEILASATSRLRIREIRLGQYSDAGDASAEMLSVQIIRGYTTPGEAGAAVTPINLQPWSRAASASVARNNTTLAQNGSPQILLADSFNVQAGFYWPGGDDPGKRDNFDDGYIYVNVNQLLVVRITAPADELTMNGTLIFEEIGKPAN